MSYDEVAYWRRRLKNGGNINSSPPHVEGINTTERYFITQYANYPEGLTLDFGVGGGRLFPLYEELGLRVLGYDIADATDLVHERHLASPNFSLVYRIGATIADTGLGDKAADATISYSVLLHQRPDHILDVMKEIMRVTKENFVMSAWEPERRPPHNLGSYCYAHDYRSLFAELDLRVIEEQRNGVEMFYAVRRK